MRTAAIERNTKETKIKLALNLDGSGKADIDTGLGFLNHMLTALTVHGGFDLTIKCNGDLEVDGHHSAEDVGICLGKAFAEALGEGHYDGICGGSGELCDRLQFYSACVCDLCLWEEEAERNCGLCGWNIDFDSVWYSI